MIEKALKSINPKRGATVGAAEFFTVVFLVALKLP